MSDADKDRQVDGEQPEDSAAGADDVFALDEEIAEATVVGAEAGDTPASDTDADAVSDSEDVAASDSGDMTAPDSGDMAAPDSGDDVLPGGEDETVEAAAAGDSLGGAGGEDSLAGAGTDYSLAGDAAEAGIEAHETPAPRPSAMRRVGTWAVVLLIVFLAGVAVWPVFGTAIQNMLPESWRQSAPVDSATQARLAALESELTALKARPAPPDNSAAVKKLDETVAAQAGAIDALRGELAKAQAATPPAPDTSGLEQRLDELAARVDTLAAVPAPASDGSGGGDSEAVAALRAQLANVAQKLAGLGGGQEALASLTSTNAALQKQVEDLQGRLAALEDNAGTASTKERKEAQILTLSQLAADLRASGGYAASLQAAKTVAAGDDKLLAELAPLQASADTGAASLRQLQQRFDAVAPEIVRAALADAGGDWLQRTANRLASLVTIRRVGEVEGNSVEAIVARAEARLGYGDLAAAVALLETLEGPPATAAAGWLASAHERLVADAAADALQRRVAGLVGAG